MEETPTQKKKRLADAYALMQEKRAMSADARKQEIINNIQKKQEEAAAPANMAREAILKKKKTPLARP